MSTYFGYVEREADNYINWADVSKDIATTFDDINKVREEKKDALDKATRETLNYLANDQPKGKNEAANKFTTNYADQMSQFLLMQQRLLKSGQLKVKDYINSVQNANDSTDNLFGTLKAYQQEYGTHMERYQNNQSSGLEVWGLKFAEGFGNFENTYTYVNPTDGSVSVALKQKKIVDGKEVYVTEPNPSQMVNIGVLKDIVSTKIDRYDVDKVTTNAAKTVGKDITTLNDAGYTITKEGIIYRGEKLIEDPLQNISATTRALDKVSKAELDAITITGSDGKPVTGFGNEGKIAAKYHELIKKTSRTADEDAFIEKIKSSLQEQIKASQSEEVLNFKEAETSMIRGIIGADENYMSVLFDNKKFFDKDKQYDFVWNEKEAGGNNIYVKVENGKLTPKLTPEQKTEAEEYVRQQLRLKYDQKYVEGANAGLVRTESQDLTGTKQPKELTDEQRKDQKNYNNAKNLTQYITWLYNGNDSQISAARQFFSSNFSIEIDRTPDGIFIEGTDKNGLTVSKNISFWDESKGRKSLGPEYFYISAFPILNSFLDDESKVTNMELGKRFIDNSNPNPNLDLFTYKTVGSEGGRRAAEINYKRKSDEYRASRYVSGGKSAAKGGKMETY